MTWREGITERTFHFLDIQSILKAAVFRHWDEEIFVVELLKTLCQ